MALSKRNLVLAVCGLTVTIPIVGLLLSTMLGPRIALSSARKRVPYAAAFCRLYPDSVAWFSYYANPYYSPVLNLKVGLYGRYVLSMHIPVDLDWSRTSVKSFGTPTFYLEHLEWVSPSADNPPGGVAVYGGSDTRLEFNEEKWQMIVEHDGDLSCLGIPIIKDKPV